MPYKKLLILSLISLFLTASFSCIPLLPDPGFEEYTLSVQPNIIVLDEDIVWQGVSQLDIQVTVVRVDQDGNFSYEYSAYGKTNSAGVFLCPQAWDFNIGSTQDEIWIRVYEENGTPIENFYKKYSEFRDRTYYRPDCVIYY